MENLNKYGLRISATENIIVGLQENTTYTIIPEVSKSSMYSVENKNIHNAFYMDRDPTPELAPLPCVTGKSITKCNNDVSERKGI